MSDHEQMPERIWAIPDIGVGASFRLHGTYNEERLTTAQAEYIRADLVPTVDVEAILREHHETLAKRLADCLRRAQMLGYELPGDGFAKAYDELVIQLGDLCDMLEGGGQEARPAGATATSAPAAPDRIAELERDLRKLCDAQDKHDDELERIERECESWEESYGILHAEKLKLQGALDEARGMAVNVTATDANQTADRRDYLDCVEHTAELTDEIERLERDLRVDVEKLDWWPAGVGYPRVEDYLSRISYLEKLHTDACENRWKAERERDEARAERDEAAAYFARKKGFVYLDDATIERVAKQYNQWTNEDWDCFTEATLATLLRDLRDRKLDV